ncbi:MAG: hypothetical protein ACKOB7_00010, partial [Methylocystis sp.]
MEKSPQIHWRSATGLAEQDKKTDTRIGLPETDESRASSLLPAARAIGLKKSVLFHWKPGFIWILSKFFARLIYKKTNTLWNLPPIISAETFLTFLALTVVSALASRCWNIP